MGRFSDKESEAVVRQQTKWEKEDERVVSDAIGALYQHANGRKFLYWLLNIGKAIGENPFTGHALSTTFNCGEQNVGQQVMSRMIEVNPDGFTSVLKEMQSEKRDRNITLEKLTRPIEDEELTDV